MEMMVAYAAVAASQPPKLSGCTRPLPVIRFDQKIAMPMTGFKGGLMPISATA